MPEFDPPILNELVTVRNPGDRPAAAVDEYGRPTSEAPSWGMRAYAHRRDRTPSSALEESVTVYQLVTVWTIRELAGIAADAEVVDAQGDVFALIGPPVSARRAQLWIVSALPGTAYGVARRENVVTRRSAAYPCWAALGQGIGQRGLSKRFEASPPASGSLADCLGRVRRLRFDASEPTHTGLGERSHVQHRYAQRWPR